MFWQASPLAQSRSYTQSSITALRDETAHMDGLSQIITLKTPLPLRNISPMMISQVARKESMMINQVARKKSL